MKPLRWPLYIIQSNRDETLVRDAKLVNGFIEITQDKQLWVYKRPGLRLYSTLPTGAGQGVCEWNGDLYVIVGGALYKNGTSVGSGMGVGLYSFSFTLGSNPQLVMQNSNNLWTYDVVGGLILIPSDQTSTQSFVVTTTYGSPTLTTVLPNTDIFGGQNIAWYISGLGIPAGTTMTGYTANTITMSANATATAINTTVSLGLQGTLTSGSGVVSSITPVLTSHEFGMGVYYVFGSGIPTGSLVELSSGSYPLTTTTMNNTASASASGISITLDNRGTPSPMVLGASYLDGTTYVMTTKAAILGSELNLPNQWDPLNSIIAQANADGGMYLGKQLAYVVAFKEWSVEFFYDAGNATGSPLAPVVAATLPMGCRDANSVATMEGSYFWVGQARDGSVCVMKLSQLKGDVISTPSIDKLIQNADYTTVYSWTARIAGHKFYVLTFVNSNLTLAYDDTTSQWFPWTDSNGNYLPIISSTYTPAGLPILQHATNGLLYSFENTQYNDNGDLITVDLYTPNYDGGERYIKFLAFMDVVADQTDGSVVGVRKSDDDYQTWSDFRYIDLGKKHPRMINGGSFRRRAYHIRHKANVPLRIQALELNMRLGDL